MSEGKQSAAASAADKVRAILEAAEQSAAALRAEAAEEIDAQLERAQGVAARLSARADHIERSALKADLEELRAVGEGVGETRAEAAEAERPPQPPTEPEDPEPAADEPAPAAAEKPAPAAAAEPATPAGDGREGARVIALNMALGGSPRDETARYLSENFELDDPDALLDEVYARAASCGS